MSTTGGAGPAGGPPGGAGGPQMSKGPPYIPSTAQVGGQPTVPVDVPISAVLLFLFVCGAATNMTIFQVNRRRGHKFVFSALLFGFCMARIAALSMRIAWATHPANIDIAIAANVFTQAGVLLLFVVNLLFAQRILRAYHPRFGWHAAVTAAFRGLLFSVIALLVMVITVSVHLFFTASPTARSQDRTVQLVAVTFLAALAFLPIPIVLLAVLMPSHSSYPENFGRGSLRTKVLLVLFTSTILALGAGFRAGAAFDVRPITAPAWFHHKAAFYCFNFGVELLVVFSYVASRFDRRFHVPDGSSGPGHYSAGNSEAAQLKAGLPDRAEDGSGSGAGADDSAWAERARKELSNPELGRPVGDAEFNAGGR